MDTFQKSSLLQAMSDTPRHLFAREIIQPSAYGDHPLPIGAGATITQSRVVALMTELLEPLPTHRVLEIGTGSGYQAAILARLSGHVYTIEIRPELVKMARENLKLRGPANITLREADGFAGWPEEAPFDRIILTAAPREIPPVLIEQLSREGRLVAPVGPWGRQQLLLLEKCVDGQIRRYEKGPAAFVPMIGAEAAFVNSPAGTTGRSRPSPASPTE